LQTVIGLLDGPGVVKELDYGTYILLAPEWINAYAQAVIRTLRSAENDLGVLPPRSVAEGKLIYQSIGRDGAAVEMKRLPPAAERVVLGEMERQLEQRGLCLRQGDKLVFPSHCGRDRPGLLPSDAWPVCIAMLPSAKGARVESPGRPRPNGPRRGLGFLYKRGASPERARPGADVRREAGLPVTAVSRTVRPMPQSLANVLLHLVWSTKHRERWIADEDRERLHAYTIGVLANLECPSLETNSEPDHIHILCSLSRTVTIAKLIEKVKTSTSAWLKTVGPQYAQFHWQGGYSSFSVSQSLVPQVREYIRNQREHHQVRSFQDELRALLKKHGMAFDERYVWD
jgi:REP element-mobilizing transposase RayT